MRLFAQLSWYFRREWQRYLGAVALLIIIAILQLIPPKVVGYVVDGVTEQHYTAARVMMWGGTLVLTAVVVYLLRYVWRVLLLDAEILILDDALSAVDGRTEHQILHNLRQWGEGRTVIISAHRLSALTEASEILVLQHGHIAQRGQHEQLAGQTGWYRDMYRYQQLEAALDEEVADA